MNYNFGERPQAGAALSSGQTATIGFWQNMNGEALIDERTPEIERLLPERALVKGGLQDGELVVVTNLEQIADGSRVQLVESAGEGER